MRLAVVTTAFNEEEGIRDFVCKVDRLCGELVEEISELRAHEIWVANNGSSDGTLKVLLDLQREIETLHVLENSANFGFDVSILNALGRVDADLYLVMCSDLEDPPAVGVQMIRDLLRPESRRLDGVLAFKEVPNGAALIRPARAAYYRIAGFGSRTPALPGFHGFGAYRRQAIVAATAYASRVAPNARKALLWGCRNHESISYALGARSGGRSSYSITSYYREGLGHILDSPSMSSRLAIRLAVAGAVVGIVMAAFFFLNYFIDVMHLPPGTTTIIMLLLIMMSSTLFVLSLIARQVERLIVPNELATADAEELTSTADRRAEDTGLGAT